MTAVAIIPARGGSKGIPKKNLRTVRGLTLVERSIIHARQTPDIGRIIVTSDDDEILSHAAECGAEPLKRPAELATDTANGDDVLVHALTSIGCTAETTPEHLTVMLLPTAPLRPNGVIHRCVRTVADGFADSILTVYPGHFAWHQEYTWAENPGGLGRTTESEWRPVLGQLRQRKNRQEIHWREQLFIENGSVYVTRSALLIKEGHRLGGRIAIETMDRADSIDVDTEYDLWLAEMRAHYLGESVRSYRAAAVSA